MTLIFRSGRWLYFLGVAAFLGLLAASVASLSFHKEALPSPSGPWPMFRVDTAHRWIAFTFDDGPSPTQTPKIIDLFKQYHARGTFFVLGSLAEKYPRVVQDIVAQGSEVDSHGFSHVRLTGLSVARLKAAMIKSRDAIREVIGKTPLFFRPTFGAYNRSVLQSAASEGETVVLWSIDTRDWSGRRASRIIKQVEKKASPGDIILFHDGGAKRSNTYKAVKTLLPALEKKGFKLVTLTRLAQGGIPVYVKRSR